MSEVIIIGLDIAKHVFTLTERMSAFSKRISRGKLLDFFAAPAELHDSAGGMWWSASLGVSSLSLATKFD
ncbi:hypothetical protein [Bradyrhizobium pachyrhizi]|uniref:hypothetical protein n=1 Tax=Bradyrhizobium pachyrhizi TaxID=280333 RepID=UPI0018E061A5|nr:hypothetical protein [Bradyrhizobium pachyrhizi]